MKVQTVEFEVAKHEKVDAEKLNSNTEIKQM